MPTIVLRDQEQQDVGFLLLAGDERAATAGERDLVFMALPALGTSPIADFLQNFKHVEFRARVAASELGFQVSFMVTPNVVFHASLATSGDGSWVASSVGGGSCQVLGNG
jgi:hypothetical protein